MTPRVSPLTYSWDFGDGTTSTAANPTHTYTAAGAKTVRLTVSDGVNSTFSPPITIQVGGRADGDDCGAARRRDVPRR